MYRRLKKSTILLGFTLLSNFFVLSSSYGEYRVYQYFVVPKGRQYYQTNKGSMVKSTLDPVSYISYHGGGTSVSVSLLRTWICPGNTGHFQELCLSPYAKFQTEQKEKEKEKEKEKIKNNQNQPPKE